MFTVARTAAMLAVAIFAVSPSFAGTMDVADFESKTLKWEVVNDNVMGGVSQGGYSIKAGQLVFEGATSLENNGGFSSIRSTGQAIDLSAHKGIAIRVKGDGRPFILTMRQRGLSRAVQFWSKFKTVRGEWTTHFATFESFEPRVYGQRLPRALKLNPARISSIGFMIYDKKAGPFKLLVDGITAADSRAELEAQGDTQSILAVAKGNKNFSTLVAAVQAAGLGEVLEQGQNLTVFAPTNAAFAALGEAKIKELLKPENKDTLSLILKHHVVAAKPDFQTLVAAGSAKMLSRQSISVGLKKGAVMFGSSTVVTGPIQCSNGQVYVIDSVLVPETRNIAQVAKSAGIFKTLLTAAAKTGLVEALTKKELTVFAPTDKAFSKVPAELLSNLLKPENEASLVKLLLAHCLNGRVAGAALLSGESVETLGGAKFKGLYEDGSLKFGAAKVLQANIAARNGVIHVIDSVLIPEGFSIARTTPVVVLKDQPEKGSALAVIRRAIELGVPLYNNGQQESCCAIYEVALRGLQLSDGVSGELRKTIATALERGDLGAAEYAWRLRRGLDAAYQQLEKTRTATMH